LHTTRKAIEELLKDLALVGAEAAPMRSPDASEPELGGKVRAITAEVNELGGDECEPPAEIARLVERPLLSTGMVPVNRRKLLEPAFAIPRVDVVAESLDGFS